VILTITYAAQRIYEFRGGFGSSALTIITVFYENTENFETNETRVDFAEYMLEHLHFLYSHCDSEEKEVIHTVSLFPATNRHPGFPWLIPFDLCLTNFRYAFYGY
jgi:hypothetical protein